MSATTAPGGQARHADAVLETFDDLLFESPEICARCFATIRDQTEHDAAAGRLGTGNRPTETLERAGDGTIGQAIEDHDAYGARQSHRARTFCGRCGAESGRAFGAEILSQQFIRGCCDRIARRLHEQGYYPDLRTLYQTTTHLKSQPEYQGRDREILAVATHLALERGRTAETPGRPRVGPDPTSR